MSDTAVPVSDPRACRLTMTPEQLRIVIAGLERQLAEAQEGKKRLKRLSEEYRLSWNAAEDELADIREAFIALLPYAEWCADHIDQSLAPDINEKIVRAKAIAYDRPEHEPALELECQLAEVRAGPQWQPIETAPKDETPILIFDPDAHHDGGGFAVAQISGDGTCLGCDELSNYVEYKPTHWARLPPPPSKRTSHD